MSEAQPDPTPGEPTGKQPGDARRRSRAGAGGPVRSPVGVGQFARGTDGVSIRRVAASRPGSSTSRRPAASRACSGCSQTRPAPGSCTPRTSSTRSMSANCPARWTPPTASAATPCGSCGRRPRQPRKDGRAVHSRLWHGFPEPLPDHCPRALVDLSRAVADTDDELTA